MNNSTNESERLILDYIKGNSTPQDLKELTRLLKKDATFNEKFREMSQAYALASSSWFERRKATNLDQLRERLSFRSSRKQTFSRRIRVWSAAAILILLIGFGTTLLYIHNSSVLTPAETTYCEIEIPRGGTSKLTLPDGSVVHLNGSTTLKYEASLHHNPQREVFLSGEAYFEVARNPEKPFIVHAEKLAIKVLGTTFNVTSYPENPDIRISLLEGSVKVSSDLLAKEEVILKPNQQAVYNKAEQLLTVRKTDAASQAAWTTGRMVFVNEKLFDILKRIERRYDVQMLIQSQKVYLEYFSGSIDSKLTLDEILSYIDVDNKFAWRKKGKTVVITDR